MSSNINQELLNSISYLDAFSGANGSLSTKGRTMILDPTNDNIIDFLTNLSACKNRINNDPRSGTVLKNVYDAMLPYLGRLKFKELTANKTEEQQAETFDELYEKLNALIGLENVKTVINGLISYHKIQVLRQKAGLKIPNRTLHLAFTGNPGTGKTTVARILGRMYKELGLLSKGHFIEVSRTDLIAGYQGQTALKVKNVIERAKGGVLFIDEAYSLTENEHSDSYGRECLTELTKALEDYRSDLVVIVAGYTDLMRDFFDSNPGLKSRFNTFVEFKDYQASELFDIFRQMCTHDDYILKEDAAAKLTSIIENEIAKENNKFANGRYVRNLYEDIIMNHAKRLDANANVSLEELQYITLQDLPAADN